MKTDQGDTDKNILTKKKIRDRKICQKYRKGKERICCQVADFQAIRIYTPPPSKKVKELLEMLSPSQTSVTLNYRGIQKASLPHTANFELKKKKL